MVVVYLKPHKEESLFRFHPWIFSGAIAQIKGKPEEGDVVRVVDSQGNFLAMGHYQIGSIMAKLEGLVAFRAALELLKERNLYHIVEEVYQKSKAQEDFIDADVINYVKEIYAPFTDQEISDKIAEMLTPKDTKAEVKIIYQTVEDLHKACPKNLGDWYFTGDYPTDGGNRVVNRAFMNFYEGKDARAY
jgi:amidophosphoribosyltransferase